ncbi:MAG TPA: peptidoglycan DD-metalloendopeptidase family protein [Caldilineaceae bacterium]|nr:peptidoglycan DD-metalloendopeptidase family protein [Caldilineaceae bacterium]
MKPPPYLLLPISYVLLSNKGRPNRLLWRAVLLAGLVLWLWAGSDIAAAPPAQIMIVEPGDVATPTPTYEIILMPTPTPQPGTPQPGQLHQSFPAVQPYVVKPHDTLLSVAIEVGVDLEEAPCMVAPTFRINQPLVIGDTLTPLPVGWRCHEVQPGESLESIAARYGVTAEQLYHVAWNRLDETPLAMARPVEGNFLRVPPAPSNALATGAPENPGLISGSGFMAFMLEQPLTVSPFVAYAIGGPRPARETVQPPPDWPYGSGHFTWPVFGWLTQGYRDDHRAIDIAAPLGAFVTAADRGVVVRAGWNEQGYGNFVVIDHNIDYVTLYSHLQDVLVREGEIVAQGQVLGTVGSSGNSTGPHLHFEIRDFGRRINPIELLTR